MADVKLKVASWNLMAPEYAERMASGRDFYAKVRAFLPWELRRPRILEHLRALDADVVCLQEISQALFDHAFRVALEKLGYELAIARKTNVFQPDGLLLLHRGGRGRVLADDVCGFLDDTGYVAQFRQLRLDRAGTHVTVANAHLKWSADDSTQVSQLRVLLARLDAFPSGPRLVCGDLNFDVASHPIWPELEARGWRTAYPDPSRATWAADGRALKADALLFSPGVRLDEVRPIPLLDPVIGLPGPQLPSDHVPLAATFTVST